MIFPAISKTSTNAGAGGLTISIFVGVWILTNLGTNLIPLERHETFVLESAREMRASGDWVLPYFNGEPRLNKPPFNYWATVAVSHLDPFGSDVEIRHGRFVSLAAGLLMALLTFRIGSILYGREAGFLCGLILMSMPGYIHYAPNARPDFLYATFSFLQLFAWIAAWRAEDRSRSQLCYGLLGWVGAALATLTKGPQAPAIFLLGILIFLLFGDDRNRTLKILRPLRGALIYSAIVLPWWILLQDRLDTIGIDLAETQLSGSLLHHLASWKKLLSCYYLLNLLFLTLPASLAIPFFLYQRKKNREPIDDISKLLLSIGITFLVVFTIGGHYRKHYLLPLLPIAALLLGNAVHQFRSLFETRKGQLRPSLWTAMALGAAGSAGVVCYRGEYLSLAILLTGAGLLFVLLRIRHRRVGPGSSGFLPVAYALTALTFTAYNAYFPMSKARAARQSFALLIQETMGPDDRLLVWRFPAESFPYLAKQIVPTVSEPEELAALMAAKTSDGIFYAVVPKKELSNIRSSFDIQVLPISGYDEDSDIELHLVRIEPSSGAR